MRKVEYAIIIVWILIIIAISAWTLSEMDRLSKIDTSLNVSVFQQHECSNIQNGSCIEYKVSCWANISNGYGETSKNIAYIGVGG